MVAAAFRTVLAYSSREEVHEHYNQVAATFAEHFAKAMPVHATLRSARPAPALAHLTTPGSEMSAVRF